MSLAFDEVELSREVTREAKGGLLYHTTIIVAGSGFERRNADYDEGLRRWEVGFIGDASESKFQTLYAFFQARKGRARAWRLYDPIDHNDIWNGTPAGIIKLDATISKYRLYKSYDDPVEPTERIIHKPIQSGFSFNGSGTLDYNTGIFSTYTPPVGDNGSWSGDFNIPVRFDTDELEMNIQRGTGRIVVSVQVPIKELLL